jgi:hypothetical protein
MTPVILEQKGPATVYGWKKPVLATRTQLTSFLGEQIVSLITALAGSYFFLKYSFIDVSIDVGETHV